MKNKKNRKMCMRDAAAIFLCLMIVGSGTVLGLNAHVKHAASERIISSEEAAELEGMDCILVLGCQVKEDGTPSHMLRDRLTRGIEVYYRGAAPKLLMSGDHGREDYNEVGTMKQIAMEAGIESSDIFMDHAGFSTYESIYRAKEIFGVRKMIIITQEYHLYRALYIAEKLGVEAYGIASDYNTYAGQSMREVREILARCKDFVTAALRLEPTYLGEQIPISGNGDVTNDS